MFALNDFCTNTSSQILAYTGIVAFTIIVEAYAELDSVSGVKRNKTSVISLVEKMNWLKCQVQSAN